MKSLILSLIITGFCITANAQDNAQSSGSHRVGIRIGRIALISNTPGQPIDIRSSGKWMVSTQTIGNYPGTRNINAENRQSANPSIASPVLYTVTEI